MKEYIADRVLQAADYIILTRATVRGCAGKFCVSKSTVHKDMAERLPQLDTDRFEKVKGVLGDNLRMRHIRGGLATRKKYQGRRLN